MDFDLDLDLERLLDEDECLDFGFALPGDFVPIAPSAGGSGTSVMFVAPDGSPGAAAGNEGYI